MLLGRRCRWLSWTRLSGPAGAVVMARGEEPVRKLIALAPPCRRPCPGPDSNPAEAMARWARINEAAWPPRSEALEALAVREVIQREIIQREAVLREVIQR